MNKLVCIVAISRRFSYGFFNNSICLRRQFNSCGAHVSPISLWQRNFSSQQDTSETGTPDVSKAIDFFLQHKEIAKAADVYESNRRHDAQIKVNEETSLQLLLCLLQINRIDDARQIAEDLTADALLAYRKGAGVILYNIFTVLGSRNKPVDDLNWFIDQLIFTRKYVDTKVLSNLIGIFLTERNDLEMSLTLFTRIAEKYGVTPWITPLLKKCIAANRNEDIETILELSSKCVEPKSILLKLASAYIEEDRALDAKKVYHSLELNNDDFGNMKNEIFRHRTRRNIRELNALLMATADVFPAECRLSIFEALLLLNANANNGKRVRELCDQMIAENLRPIADIKAISTACNLRNIELPESWLPKHTFPVEHEHKLRSMLDDANQLAKANAYFIDTMRTRKRYSVELITSLLRMNGVAGCVREMDLLRTVIPDKMKWVVQFYDNECLAYMKVNRHLEYVEVVRWEITNQKWPSIPATIVDLMIECPRAYTQLLELTKQYSDTADVVRLVCLLWTHNFIQNTNLADNERMWYAHMKNLTTISVTTVTDVLYQRKRIDKLREFLNSSQFEKRRVKSHQLGKCYSRLFDGLLEAGDHATIKAELRKAAKHISAKHLEPDTLQSLKNESTELETIIADMNTAG